jgi:hypothetical protein
MDLDFSDKDLEVLAALGVTDEQIADLRKRMRENRDLMNTPAPQGRGFGNIYRAPNWMETAGQMGSMAAGAYGYRKNQRELKTAEAAQTAARKDVMDRLLGRGRYAKGTPLQDTPGRFLMTNPPAPAANSPVGAPMQPTPQEIQAEYLRRMAPGGSYSA